MVVLVTASKGPLSRSSTAILILAFTASNVTSYGPRRYQSLPEISPKNCRLTIGIDTEEAEAVRSKLLAVRARLWHSRVERPCLKLPCWKGLSTDSKERRGLKHHSFLRNLGLQPRCLGSVRACVRPLHQHPTPRTGSALELDTQRPLKNLLGFA